MVIPRDFLSSRIRFFIQHLTCAFSQFNNRTKLLHGHTAGLSKFTNSVFHTASHLSHRHYILCKLKSKYNFSNRQEIT
nr:MAG TPA: hypothetical protein [Caudoviricetes sp.]